MVASSRPRPSDPLAIHSEAGGRIVRMSRSTRLLRTLLRVALTLLLVVVGMRWLLDAVAIVLFYQPGFDFGIYYAAALAIRDNPSANLFDPHVLQTAAHAHHVAVTLTPYYVYPPLLAILLVPLTFLPVATASLLWSLMNLTLWLGCTVLVVRFVGLLLVPLSGGRSRSADRTAQKDVSRLVTILAIVMMLSYQPMRQGVQLGQINVIICFLALLSASACLRKSDTLAGVMVALASWLKVYPTVWIVYYVIRRRWRLAVVALTVSVGLVLALLPVIGLSGALSNRRIVTDGSIMAAQYHNEALAHIPLWLTVEVGGQPGIFTSIVGYVLIAVIALIFIAVVHRTGPNHGERVTAAPVPLDGRMTDLLGSLWALCTMVLVAPLAWEHHYTWVLPVCVVCFGYVIGHVLLRNGGRLEVLLALVLGLGYVLTMSDLPFGFDGDAHFDIGPFIGGHPLRPFFMLLRPLGALLIWTASGTLYWRQSRNISQIRCCVDGPIAEEVGDLPDPVTTTRRIGVVLLGILLSIVVTRILLSLALAVSS